MRQRLNLKARLTQERETYTKRERESCTKRDPHAEAETQARNEAHTDVKRLTLNIRETHTKRETHTGLLSICKYNRYIQWVYCRISYSVLLMIISVIGSYDHS